MGLFSKKTTLFSPCTGEYKKLEDVEDAVFSKKMLGDGFAVVPSEETICAPVDGTITMVFPTKHAVGITDKYGIEYILHIGVDTVNLKGEGFTLKVNEGEKVKAGDALVQVDFDVIRNAGYITDVLVIVTNAKEIHLKSDLKQLHTKDTVGFAQYA